MVSVRRIVLDVLKPHRPDVLDFASRIAREGELRIRVMVMGVDEHTESLQVEVEGDDIVLDDLRELIASLGGSVHSIDEVVVESQAGNGER